MGPGLREDWLADLRREGLIGELLADGVIAAAVADGGHGHRLDRALTAEVTALCVITGSLFPDQGYDLTLAGCSGCPETAFLHLRKTGRGPRRVLRGRSVPLVRQEARALVLVHNMIAAIAAQAASSALSFTAVLSLARS